MTKLVGEKVRMRIWIGEGDKHGDELLYEALVKLFREEGFAGDTVIRGIAGYGARNIYRSGKTPEMSRDLPIIVIAVDTQEKIDRVMPRIDEMMSGGMITHETVTVLRYAHKHA
jgi:PII-like signaling protein